MEAGTDWSPRLTDSDIDLDADVVLCEDATARRVEDDSLLRNQIKHLLHRVAPVKALCVCECWVRTTL